MTAYAIWGAALLLATALSFFFSGTETGYYTVNRVRLRIAEETGQRGAAAALRHLGQPGPLLFVLLVGNNLANFAASFCSQELLLRAVGPAGLALWNTLLLSPFLFVFGEITPKDCFRKRSDRWIPAVARILAPAVAAAAAYRRAFPAFLRRRRPTEERGAFATRRRIELSLLEGAERGVVSGQQSRLARNILGLRDKPLWDVMVPRAELPSIPEDATVAEALRVARETGEARLAVERAEGPDLAGVVSVADLLGREGTAPVREHVRALPRLDGSLTVMWALLRLRAERRAQAAVLRGRETVGWVTVRDLVEEIVGEIRDW